jgi:hypothetical protein
MSRSRTFKSLNECVNPKYLKHWNYAVTVKDAIDFSITRIVDVALRKRNRGYEVRVLLPDYTGCRSIMEHIFVSLSAQFSNHRDIELAIGDEKMHAGDIVIEFVAMATHPAKRTIPIRWEDELNDWTWCNVVANGGLYPSSSTDVWPPTEYKIRADRENMRQLRSNYFA